MSDDLPDRQRHPSLILAICCSSLFIVTLDATVTNVALPTIGRELHAGVTGLQWTLDAYTLTLASLLVIVAIASLSSTRAAARSSERLAPQLQDAARA